MLTRTPIRHVVIFTNPKTTLEINHASHEVREKVLRTDGLVKYITQALEDKFPVHFWDNYMSKISNAIRRKTT